MSKPPKLELVDIDGLAPHPDNPNEGDVGEIADLIIHNGWFAGCQVQIRPDEPDRIFVGEHRWRALRGLQASGGVVRTDGAEVEMTYDELRARAARLDLPELPPAGKIWVQRYEISDALARRHLLAENHARDLATYDDSARARLLSDIANSDPDGLLGTSYSDAAFDAILRGQIDPAATADHFGPGGTPPEDRYREQYGIVVICTDEAHQALVYDDLVGQGFNVRVVAT